MYLAIDNEGKLIRHKNGSMQYYKQTLEDDEILLASLEARGKEIQASIF